ncbi:CDGSH iron-sulfur domain-containing protein [Streptomyces sp. PLK6-54]|uniref:CDGSH iron-sulfur domain-containing protein n=1 Tax=Actinacidiphila acidipaludis TaxID=2873382 RepID=A0ABS7QIQ5_9ACTN|nr:CDGSH iron-sulfur domain-containing protein [Streptomyces acidipaludis]MBY8883056.1 CDGSH iron-sulfur domain-containing protein [Streptomyces acidipaludis]
MVVDPDGPLLVEGPVEVVGPDGTVSRSDRFVVAVCTCRRTRTAPWCDTSHRCHERPARARRAGGAPAKDTPKDTPGPPQESDERSEPR